MPHDIQSVITSNTAVFGSALALDAASARIEVQMLLQAALKVNRAYLLAHPEQQLDAEQQVRCAALLERRLRGEPVAYIIGEREFFGLTFKVTPATLIPRHDTELLVELTLQRIPQLSPSPASVRGRLLRVLDLGTGSGAIALSIAHARRDIEVTAVDASREALAVARENAQRLLQRGDAVQIAVSAVPDEAAGHSTKQANGLAAGYAATREPAQILAGQLQADNAIGNARLLHSDWFLALAGEYFDLIVSNPPYIAEDDVHLAQGDLRFEPRAALASGADGLDDIRRIVTGAKLHLYSGGWLLFEHGHDQSAKARELLLHEGYAEVFSACDLAGIARVSGGRII